MKISFIRPAMFPGRSRDAMAPLVFSVLAALTPPDVETELFDERIETIPAGHETDLVALTVDTYCARRSYELATRYHKRGAMVVMGGAHATLCLDEVLPFADAVVVGDAEDVWLRIVRDAQKGKLERIYRSRLESLTGAPVDRGIFKGKRYGAVDVLQFGRGCRHNCDFCSVRSFYGTSFRSREPAAVAEDLAGLRGGWVFVVDDNLFSDVEAGYAFCRAVKPLRKKWVCQTSIDNMVDGNIVETMAGAGCVAAVMGFESMETDNLRQMRKAANLKHNLYKDTIKALADHGIMTYGTFVLGYDADTPDTVKRNLEFAIEAKMAIANFNQLMPFPGTSLIERLRASGRLVYDRWWLDPAYSYGDITFIPKQMKPDTLRECCYHAKMAFSASRSILHRALDGGANARNLHLFLAANVVSRFENRRKQGVKLGSGEEIAPFMK